MRANRVTRRPSSRDRRAALPAAYRVGRDQPNDEIAELEVASQQLLSDLQLQKPTGMGQKLDQWLALSLNFDAWRLRWGQFKTAMASDLWWGDDDEVRFTELKTDYNTLRQKIIDFTDVDPTAPEVEEAPPGETDTETKVGLGLGALLVVGLAVGFGVYKLLPTLAPLLQTAVAAKAARS